MAFASITDERIGASDECASECFQEERAESWIEELSTSNHGMQGLSVQAPTCGERVSSSRQITPTKMSF